jgi:hypothetical protein
MSNLIDDANEFLLNHDNNKSIVFRLDVMIQRLTDSLLDPEMKCSDDYILQVSDRLIPLTDMRMKLLEKIYPEGDE